MRWNVARVSDRFKALNTGDSVMTDLMVLLQHAATILTTRTGLVVDLATITTYAATFADRVGECKQVQPGQHRIGIDLACHKDDAEIIYTLVHELIHAAIG